MEGFINPSRFESFVKKVTRITRAPRIDRIGLRCARISMTIVFPDFTAPHSTIKSIQTVTTGRMWILQAAREERYRITLMAGMNPENVSLEAFYYSTGTKRPAEETGLRLLFQRSFLRWRSSVLKLKPRLWQNSLRRIPLLTNSATNC